MHYLQLAELKFEVGASRDATLAAQLRRDMHGMFESQEMFTLAPKGAFVVVRANPQLRPAGIRLSVETSAAPTSTDAKVARRIRQESSVFSFVRIS